MKAMKAIAVLATFMALFIVCGCQPSDPALANSATTAAKVSDESLKITEIKIANEQSKNAQSVSKPITTADPVIVWLSTNGSGKTVKLDAKLFSLSNGQTVGALAQPLTARSSATKLTFTPEARWIAGRYLLEIKLDGKLAEQRDIDIIDLPPQQDSK